MRGKKKSPWPVFIAIILAVFAGVFSGTEGTFLGIKFYYLYDLLSKLFINSLTLIMVPLVSSSIITGIARIGNDAAFKRIGSKALLFYFATTLVAILIGLLFVNLFRPGHALASQVFSDRITTASDQVQQHVSSMGEYRIGDVFLQIVPPNIVDVFSSGHMLGLIFFSLLFGYALSRIEGVPRTTLLGFWQGVFQTTIHVTHLIMKCLPIGVFCLVAKVFATTGLESLLSLGLFTIAVLFGLAIFVFVGLPLLLKYIGKVNPWRHFKAMSPALITAFSTSSSSATLPITIECVEKRAGVSNRICSLVIPLGTSLNMSGSALYECVAAMFVAQAYGVDLSFTTQVLVVMLSLIASMGVAGIPAASLVAVVVILKALGLPVEGVGLFVAMDRILDMCRTTVNVFSDSCCAVLIARSEGETNILQSDQFEEV